MPLSTFLYRLSSGPVTLAALIGFLLFGALVLPAQAQKAELYSNGADSPDTSFFYSKNDLYKMAEMYGEAGRAQYVRARFTFDLIFPLVYLAFLVTSISWIFVRAFPDVASRWRLLNLFPVFGALFDYLENIAASLVMTNYPAQTPVMDGLAPIFTLLKWFFVNGSFVVLAAGVFVMLWRRFASRGLKTP
ncbi:MAG: hypothetical protein JNM02_10270 [Anaerolineales bacterium]|nr:hypothetical protein [Anaerolineales bacterium]